MFIVEEFKNSSTIDVDANNYCFVNIDTFVIPSGYVPFSVIKVETGNTYISIESFNAESGVIRAYNESVNKRACQPMIKIVFIKSDYI